ncbi:MAG: MFS transporter [Chloroflexota bacterium]|nr:MFS transporter [Chloroflexota bacterium]
MNTSLVGRVRFLRAFHSRSFVLFWAGQTISIIGNGAFTTALAWQVFLLTHSATALGIILTAQTIPTLFFILVGGITADRFPRRLLLLWSDAGRAVAVFLVTLLSWLQVLQLWHLIALGLAFGIAGSFFYPAFRALPPQLVASDDLPSANALTELSIQAGMLLGPVVGALCLALGGATLAFGFDGLTFVISVLSLAFIRLSPSMVQRAGRERETHAPTAVPSEQRETARTGLVGVIAGIREGMSYIRDSRWLLVTILVPAIGSFGSSAPISVVLPKLIHDVYGAGVWLLGGFGTAVGLGWIGAAFFVGQVHLPRRGIVAFLAHSLASVALLALGLAFPRGSEPTIALVAGVLYGFGVGTLQTIWVTLLHELVPNDKLGRVSSIDLLGTLSLAPIAYLVAGSLADHFGPAWVFLAGGFLNLVLNGIALSLRDIRELA